MLANPQRIAVDRIFLDLSNPRHEPSTNESEVIDYLCREEYVYALAKDIVKMGLNPLELFGLLPTGSKKKPSATATYLAAEGNRRVCAIKLLNDPDLAPADMRKDFRALSEQSSPIKEVWAVILNESQKEAWLERIHGGPQNGIGRKPWNADQKARNLGSRKNALALSVLDYSEERGFISGEERKGKLTTAQRYLGNSFLREAIGVEGTASDDISITRPLEEFDLLLKTFMRDLVDNRVHSRSDSSAIKEYSRNLGATEGVTTTRTASASLLASLSSKRPKRRPTEPRKPKSIAYENEIATGLRRIRSYKLQKLYFSICEVPLDKHTLLISVGVWSFFETLTARCGRAGTDFHSYLSANKLTTLGFSDKNQRTIMSQAVKRISEYGNTTKHHDVSANFNGEQLANDMDTLKDLTVALIKDTK